MSLSRASNAPNSLARILAALVIFVALAALLGWATGNSILKAIVPGAISMNPLTAFGFILAALALWQFAERPPSPPRRAVGWIAAVLIMLLGLWKMAEYLLDSAVGPDTLLLPGLKNNEIAPNTAVCFALLGLSLLLLDLGAPHRLWRWLAQILAGIVTVQALAALVGYGYGVTVLYGLISYVPMAFNTALAFAILGAGVLCAHPHSGLMRLLRSPGPGGGLVRLLLPVAIVVPAVLGWLRLAGQQAGFYPADSGIALFAVANMIVFSIFVLSAGRWFDNAEARRLEVEHALEQERQLLHALMDHVPDSIYFKDRDSRFTRINRALAERLGLRHPDEALGKSDADFFTPEHAGAAGADEQEVLRTGQAVPAKEEREIWRDGRRRWVLTTRLPLRNPAGDLIGTFGVSRDITERKRAEEALREAEEQLRLLLDSTGEGIYELDPEGRCTYINRAAAELLGYAPDEVRGKDMHALVHHSRADGSPYPLEVCPILHTVATGQGERVDSEVFWRRDGSAFPAEYSAYPIRGRKEQIKGVVVIFKDNTERNRLRSMLVQSEKLASIGLLSAGIAHEINNPLSYVANNLVVLQRDVKGMAELLDLYEAARDRLASADPAAAKRIQCAADDLDLAYVRENFERVLARTREGVQRVVDIVQSLRSLARTDRPQFEDAQLAEIIDMALEMVRGRLRRRGIEVELDLRAPRLRCVPTQLGQVFLNLVTNAMQAVESRHDGSGGRIRFASRPAGGGIAIEVADNGCGIDPSHLEQIFDPFFTTKAVGEGTGLGLAITHGIITGHGGRIEVKSRPGEGTSFHIFLPGDPSRAAAPHAVNNGTAIG